MHKPIQKAVEYHALQPAGPAPLLAVAGALLEMQHYSPGLLEALKAAVRAQGAAALALPAGQLVDLLLVLAFFRAADQDLVTSATDAVASALTAQLQQAERAARNRSSKGSPEGPEPPSDPSEGEEVSDDQVGRLVQAGALLQSQGFALSAALAPALAAAGGGPEPLFVADHLVSDPEVAAEALRQPQGAEWDAAGLFSPAQVVTRLEGGLGFEVEWGEVVGAAPFSVEVEKSIRVCGDGTSSSGSSSGRIKGGAVQQEKPQRQVAVAVLDEESCYCPFPVGRLRGSVAAQVLVLQSLGWAVVPVPVREWVALGGDAATQDAYLKARVAAAVG
jgi:hypothetical protein